MAGVKGRSGGPRKNAGGSRPGAGRKPSKKASKKAKKSANAATVEFEAQAHGGSLKRTKATPVPQADIDMLELLKRVALGEVQATTVQVRAAIAAVQYTHVKKGEGGKKDAAKEAAEKASAGRFAPKGPPRLVVNNAK